MRAAKVDANQKSIVDALRRAGASVQLLHRVGEGCPDALAGYRGRNVLVEIKDGAKPPSARKLNDVQVEWHAAWRGQVATVTSEAEAFAAVGITTNKAARQDVRASTPSLNRNPAFKD